MQYFPDSSELLNQPVPLGLSTTRHHFTLSGQNNSSCVPDAHNPKLPTNADSSSSVFLDIDKAFCVLH